MRTKTQGHYKRVLPTVSQAIQITSSYPVTSAAIKVPTNANVRIVPKL